MSSPSLELKSEVVRAGAGAGKTTRLVERVLNVAAEFKRQHQRFPRFVITTFTRKATQELRERLMRKSLDLADEELTEFVASRHHLQISTIHGVLALFLSRFGHLAGLDNGFRVIADNEARHLARVKLRDVLLAHPKRQELLDLKTFNEWAALSFEFYGMMLEHPALKPFSKEDFAVSLGERLNELSTELQDLVREVEKETQDEKFLSYAAAVKGLAMELKSAARLPVEKWNAHIQAGLERIPARKPSFSSKNPQMSEHLDRRLGATIKKAKEELGSSRFSTQYWDELLRASHLAEGLFENFTTEFEKAKRLRGQYEIRDLELLALKVLRLQPELGQAFAADWDYWMVDEYQDTSPVQVELLKHLVGRKPLFTVGDPQQSIFLFRGARTEVFAERESHLREIGGVVDSIRLNHRSSPELLAFVNEFFQLVDDKSFSSMEAARKKEFPKLDTQAYFYACQEETGENQAVAAHVQKLRRETQAPFDQICVIARTNRQLREIAQYLQSVGIPTHVHASSGFSNRREIQDAMSLLKFLVNPHDDRNLISLLRTPYLRLGDQEIFELRQAQTKGQSLWQFWLKADQALTARELFFDLLKLRDEVGIMAALERALIENGFFDFARRHDATGRREANYWKLLEQLAQNEKQPGFSWLDFINRTVSSVNALEDQEETDAVAALEPNCVNLMTVHASKGLEFHHVILARCSSPARVTRYSSLPFDEKSHRWGLMIRDEEGESVSSICGRLVVDRMGEAEKSELKRLLYVGVTRAKHTVAFTWSEPIAKGSWAEHLSSWMAEEGHHKGNGYHYQLIRETQVEIQTPREEVQARPRKAYEFKASAKTALESISVSRFLERHAPAVDTRTYEGKANLMAASEGILFHRLMESLHYHPQLPWSKLAGEWFQERSSQAQKAIEYALQLRAPPLKDLIEKGQVEWGFQILIPGAILEGQIDLWGQIDGTTWVLDYKTGSAAYTEKAFDQLDLYAHALRRSGVQGPIQRAVLFPFSQKLEVRPMSSEADLAKRFPSLLNSN